MKGGTIDLLGLGDLDSTLNSCILVTTIVVLLEELPTNAAANLDGDLGSHDCTVGR